MGEWTAQDRQMAREWIEQGQTKYESVTDFVLEQCKRSKPSDRVCLDYKTDVKLWDLWKKRAELPEGRYSIPSDIIFANTIPLKDCEIEVDETDRTGMVCKYRAVMFDGFSEIAKIIKKFEEEGVIDSPESYVHPIIVGALIIEIPIIGKAYFPITVSWGFDFILLVEDWVFIKRNNGEILKRGDIQLSRDQLVQMGHEYLLTWYSIQISLLHPQIKEIYKSIDPQQKNTKKSVSKQTKRHAKLIKRLYVEEEDINEVLKPKRSIHRKTLVWYVCGHFRHYQDGRIKFIQPYWKGALREIKRNLDEGRDRIIAAPAL